jgi:tetrahydromethanopterin S-methyltransferase subunit G
LPLLRFDADMTEQVENLILEYLKAIRVDIALIKARLDDLTARVTSLENHVAIIVGDILRMNTRFDHLEMRIDRIERRLELVT